MRQPKPTMAAEKMAAILFAALKRHSNLKSYVDNRTERPPVQGCYPARPLRSKRNRRRSGEGGFAILGPGFGVLAPNAFVELIV
jgi:hypothetical protein